jgi:hypothetical protein
MGRSGAEAAIRLLTKLIKPTSILVKVEWFGRVCSQGMSLLLLPMETSLRHVVQISYQGSGKSRICAVKTQEAFLLVYSSRRVLRDLWEL